MTLLNYTVYIKVCVATYMHAILSYTHTILLSLHTQCDSSGGGKHPASGDSEHEAHQWGPENKVQGGAIVPRLVYTSTTGMVY